MKYYTARFSGGTWSNDYSEDPYYAGVYSSLQNAERFVAQGMRVELNCEDLSLSYSQLSELYKELDCEYIIESWEILNSSNIVYTLDYRPYGMAHGSLGAFGSLEEAKQAAIIKMKEEIGNNNIDISELMKIFNEKIGLDSGTFFITRIEVDTELFYLDWDGNYFEGYQLRVPHHEHDWYTVIDENLLDHDGSLP